MKAGRGLWLGVVVLLAGCRTSTGTGETRTREEGGPTAGACLKEGEGASSFEQRPGAPGGGSAQECCPGLTRLEAYESSSLPKQCLVSKGGRYVCTHCGDGLCREGENPCNCPKDCP